MSQINNLCFYPMKHKKESNFGPKKQNEGKTKEKKLMK